MKFVVHYGRTVGKMLAARKMVEDFLKENPEARVFTPDPEKDGSLDLSPMVYGGTPCNLIR